MSSQCLWKCYGRQKLRWSLGEKSDGFRNRKSRAQSIISLAWAILSQNLVLKYWLVLSCCRVLMPLFARVNASQPDNWCSVFNKQREMLSHHSISWVFEGLREMGSPDRSVEHKTEVKAISSELLVRFDAKRVTLSRIVTANETWAHRFETETKRKSMEWHRLHSPGKKTQTFSVSGWGHDDCLLGPWRIDSCGCDAEKGDRSSPTSISGREQNSPSSEFGITIIQQKSCFSMTMQGRTQIWKIGTTSQNLVGQWNSIHLAAPIQHLQIHSYLEPEGYNPQYEVWDSGQCFPYSRNLITWAAKGVVSTRYTYLFLVGTRPW